ncbi:3-phosphoshikimate 1-carboxyvinyltransferase [Vagococcus sp. PNs007]|uniref:3-phosphoshikimate 1-carboxyvinyltransferase n=1 Tax=Vagococcus proximus TaxID=2991417 RepID=A0ABT5WZA0_9ENTE|nr:3-phosphoshikimate 1-carboxyvinyltransferase [Vagococcus proximus]MDF0479092.1 3-phosphoshikimate 1-carboxyvinyltransferase [Vagococcus proximus]
MKLKTNVTKLVGKVIVPGDKSISHRSIMLGAMAYGTTVVNNFLLAEDCLETVILFKTLGADIEVDSETATVTINGGGLQSLTQPNEDLYVGNSGTTMRLGLGVLSGVPFMTRFKGDESLSKRPMERVMAPLREMMAITFSEKGGDTPPIIMLGTSRLRGRTHKMTVASAQVKSAILLAGLSATGETVVEELEQTRNHTEQMIQQFGGELTVSDKTIRLIGPQVLTGTTVVVPGDISSAAYFIAAGVLVKDSEITLPNIGLNPTRTGILNVLESMGAQYKIKNKTEGSEPRGTIKVCSSDLKATTIEGNIIPTLIDELPIIALLATQADGKTIIKDAAELKVKETNRIDLTAEELNKMGAKVTPTEDGLIIEGPTPLKAAKVSSHGDHRLGMMLSVAALLVKDGDVELENVDSIRVSYPSFIEDLTNLVESK